MVYFPNKSESIFTRRKSKLYIFACWMLPLLVMTPSLTGAWGDHKLDYCARSCTIVDEENVKLKFKTFIYALGVVFPTLMLIIFNIILPTVDIFFDAALIQKLLLNDFLVSGVFVSLGIFTNFLFTSLAWWRLEPAKQKNWSWIFLALQLWPQLRAFQVFA